MGVHEVYEDARRGTQVAGLVYRVQAPSVLGLKPNKNKPVRQPTAQAPAAAM